MKSCTSFPEHRQRLRQKLLMGITAHPSLLGTQGRRDGRWFVRKVIFTLWKTTEVGLTCVADHLAMTAVHGENETVWFPDIKADRAQEGSPPLVPFGDIP
jgi:hypothetical protein